MAIQMASAEEKAVKRATRAALGTTLVKLADEGLPVVAVDADLSGSTTLGKLGSAKPEYANRFYNVGIAEQTFVQSLAAAYFPT